MLPSLVVSGFKANQDTKGKVTDNNNTHYPYRVIVEHGSHVNNPETASDIDVVYFGLDESEVKFVVENLYPGVNKPVDAILDNTIGYPLSKIYIPAPCDAEAPYKIIYMDPPNSKPPPVEIVRYYNNIISILRERAGPEKAFERIKNMYSRTYPFMENCTELVIEESAWEDGSDVRKMSNFQHNYCGSLTSLRKAARSFGDNNFEVLCQKLWWGGLLSGLVQRAVKKDSIVNIRNGCSGYTGRLFLHNETQKVHLMYSESKNVCGENIQEVIEYLIEKEEPK